MDKIRICVLILLSIGLIFLYASLIRDYIKTKNSEKEKLTKPKFCLIMIACSAMGSLIISLTETVVRAIIEMNIGDTLFGLMNLGLITLLLIIFAKIFLIKLNSLNQKRDSYYDNRKIRTDWKCA